MSESATGAQRVLFVCLGNICRSPTAHGILREVTRAEGRALRIDSAGTGNWHEGAAPDPRTRAAAHARGVDLSDLRARQITAADFARFDLILAMDESNRRDIERLRPAGAETPVHLLLDYAPGSEREVPDPYLGGGFTEVFTLLETACRALVDAMDRR